MTAKYSDAEKSAAKRIGYTVALRSTRISPEWLDDFRRVCVDGWRAEARANRKEARALAAHAETYDAWVADGRLVARAIAREQRRAARS